jgi:hypothetical protein
MLAELQANLKSIVRQVSLVFLGFLVLLLVTGGHLPSSWLVTYIVIGVLFVAWDEYRRNFHYSELSEKLVELAEEESNQQSQRLITKNSQLVAKPTLMKLTSVDLTSARSTSADPISMSLILLGLTSVRLTSAEPTFLGLTSAELTFMRLTLAELTFTGLISVGVIF